MKQIGSFRRARHRSEWLVAAKCVGAKVPTDVRMLFCVVILLLQDWFDNDNSLARVLLFKLYPNVSSR